MNKNVLVAVGVVFVVIVGYLIYSSKSSQPPINEAVKTETVPPEDKTKELVVNLNAQSDSTESGKAMLKEVSGKVMVSLDLTGAPKSIIQPAHIHMGSCPIPGEVKYPLTSILDGKSETTLDIGLDQLLKELPLAINVHKSASEAKVYVTCGNLQSASKSLQ